MTAVKKNLIGVLFLVAFILLLLIFLPRPVQAAAQFEDAIITGDQVNMRLRPSTDAPVILKFSESTRVGVFAEEGDWYRIIYGNYRGYVSKEYVFLSSTDVLVGNILTDGTPVYQSPGGYGEAVETLSVGAGVTIENVIGDYYQITLEEGEKEGYVTKDAIKTSTAKAPVTLLKEGMEGVEVKKMQTQLRKRGFLGSSATGYFGDETKQAVIDFQKEAGISADGVAGAQTLELVHGDNDIRTNAAKKAGITGKVEMTEWDEAKNILAKGTEALVTDVKTGLQFRIRRFGGWFHADCEPLTKEDSANIKKAAGGEWSWNRRAIWVTVGDKTMAASMHSMPHMANPTPDNGFDGHFCIHFKGSKVHENEKECPRHQAKVREAYNAAQ